MNRELVDVKLDDVAADEFVAFVAEHRELGAVDAQDGPIGRDPVEAYGGVLEEVGKLLLVSTHRDLDAASLRDVPKDQDAADDFAELAADWSGVVFDGALSPVLRDQEGMVRRPHDRAFPQRPSRGAFDFRAGRFAHDAEDFAELQAGGLCAAPAGERFGHWVHPGNAGLGVGGDDRVTDACESGAEALGVFGNETLVAQNAAADDDAGYDSDERPDAENGEREADDGAEPIASQAPTLIVGALSVRHELVRKQVAQSADRLFEHIQGVGIRAPTVILEHGLAQAPHLIPLFVEPSGELALSIGGRRAFVLGQVRVDFRRFVRGLIFVLRGIA